MAALRAGEFAGSVGLSPQVLVEAVNSGMEPLNFDQRRSVGEHFAALAELFGGSPVAESVAVEPVAEPEATASVAGPVQPVARTEEATEAAPKPLEAHLGGTAVRADQSAVVNDPSDDDHSEVTHAELVEILDNFGVRDKPLGIDLRGWKAQNRQLDIIFGDSSELATRLPIDARQRLMDEVLVRLEASPQTAKKMASNKKYAELTRARFRGQALLSVGVTLGIDNVTAFIDAGNKRLIKSGVDLDGALRTAILELGAQNSYRPKAVGKVAEEALAASTPAPEQSETPEPVTLDVAIKRLADSMGITGKREETLLKQIFDLKIHDAYRGEDISVIRAKLRVAVDMVNNDAFIDGKGGALEKPEQDILRALTGTPNPDGGIVTGVTPRTLYSLKRQKKIEQYLREKRMKIEDVVAGALVKVADNENRLAVAETN